MAVLSYFEGTANLHCYTSCTLSTLHCSKVSFLQCCHIKSYNKIFTKIGGVYSLLWDTVTWVAFNIWPTPLSRSPHGDGAEAHRLWFSTNIQPPVQCIRKVFTALHFFHILCYSLIPRWIKCSIFHKILKTIPLRLREVRFSGLINLNFKHHVWRKAGTAHPLESTIPKVKCAGRRLMLWGYFSAAGNEGLVRVEQMLSAPKYCNSINDND